MRNIKDQSVRSVGYEILKSDPAPWSEAMRFARVMTQYDSIDEPYARDAVRAFLDSAKSWRGPHARKIKRQLRSML